MSDQGNQPDLDELAVLPTGKTTRDEPDDQPAQPTPPTTGSVDPTPPTSRPADPPPPPGRPEPGVDDDPVVPTGKTIRDEPQNT